MEAKVLNFCVTPYLLFLYVDALEFFQGDFVSFKGDGKGEDLSNLLHDSGLTEYHLECVCDHHDRCLKVRHHCERYLRVRRECLHDHRKRYLGQSLTNLWSVWEKWQCTETAILMIFLHTQEP